MDLKKIMVFGNSGSGKSTLAQQYSTRFAVPVLDLDILAWLPTNPPQRAPLEQSFSQIDVFIANNSGWVIEGCYADLLSKVTNEASEMFFLNPGVKTCIENSRNRPWEPHKYASKQAQDKNLPMLIEWISQYPEREDEFSLSAHQKLFNAFGGKKTEILSNERKPD